MKYLFNITILVFLLFSDNARSQSISREKIVDIYSSVSLYLYNCDNIKGAKTQRSSEVVVCFLYIDATGKIADVNVLGDPNNKDSVVNYLDRMPISVFKNWKSEKSKGKTIMLSIVCFSQGKTPEYIKNLKQGRKVQPISIISETDKMIIVSPFEYNSPIDDGHPRIN
jgi:hypothetical protein